MSLQKYKNYPLIENKLDTPQYDLFRECQVEIIKSRLAPYYNEGYQYAEIYHLVNVIEWLYNLDWQPSSILDIGAAYGTLSLFCRKKFVCPVFVTDFMDRPSLSFFKALGKLEDFKVNNIETEELPWKHKFDIILLTEVLEHFNFHPAETLVKINKALSDQGILILTTPDADSWGRAKRYKSLEEMPPYKEGIDLLDQHNCQYTKRELLHLLKASKFNVLTLEYSPGATARQFNILATKYDT